MLSTERFTKKDINVFDKHDHNQMNLFLNKTFRKPEYWALLWTMHWYPIVKTNSPLYFHLTEKNTTEYKIERYLSMEELLLNYTRRAADCLKSCFCLRKILHPGTSCINI